MLCTVRLTEHNAVLLKQELVVVGGGSQVLLMFQRIVGVSTSGDISVPSAST